MKIVCVEREREKKEKRKEKAVGIQHKNTGREKSPLFFVCVVVNASPSAPPGFILYISLFFFIIIIIIIIMGNFFSLSLSLPLFLLLLLLSLLLLFWRPFRPTMSVEPWLENNTPQKRKEWGKRRRRRRRRRRKKNFQMKKPEKNEADGKGGPSKKKSNQIEVKEKERGKEKKERSYCEVLRLFPRITRVVWRLLLNCGKRARFSARRPMGRARYCACFHVGLNCGKRESWSIWQTLQPMERPAFRLRDILCESACLFPRFTPGRVG